MLEDIKKLQEYLKNNSIDAYIISSNDDHGSEYIGDHFKARAYFSSFTGSAGTLVVTKEKVMFGLMEDIFFKQKLNLKNQVQF